MEKKIKKCEIGYFVDGVSTIPGSIIFVETEDEAIELLNCGPIPQEVIRVNYVYMTQYAGFWIPRDTLVNSDTRKRYYSDPTFAKIMRYSQP
jgi:hypothetical protein